MCLSSNITFSIYTSLFFLLLLGNLFFRFSVVLTLLNILNDLLNGLGFSFNCLNSSGLLGSLSKFTTAVALLLR